MALYGLPVRPFMRTRDREERLMWIAIAQRVAQLDEIRLHRQAQHIVNELGKALRRRG